MFASFYLTFLAFVVSLVAAGNAVTTGTTTSTISMTQTITITRCNPSVTNCPANRHNTTTSTHWPVSNSSTVAWPTSYHNKTTSAHATGTGSGAVSTVVLSSTPAVAPSSSPTGATTSGAQGLIIQSGLLLGGLAAAIAILA